MSITRKKIDRNRYVGEMFFIAKNWGFSGSTSPVPYRVTEALWRIFETLVDPSYHEISIPIISHRNKSQMTE